RMAVQYMNFTVELNPTSGFGSYLGNGSWNGMIGLLQRKEAEMAPLDFTPSYSRRAVVDFSPIIGSEKLAIISQAPVRVPRPFLLFQIYAPLV
ncbi:Ionotropic glutamate receptor L-glutamate and glycine-binding domain, partial [Trinorchestia longiramus]